MLSIHLPKDAEKRVEQIARQAGYDTDDFARELILAYLRQRDNHLADKASANDFYGLWSDIDLDAQAIDEWLRNTRQHRFKGMLDAN